MVTGVRSRISCEFVRASSVYVESCTMFELRGQQGSMVSRELRTK